MLVAFTHYLLQPRVDLGPMGGCSTLAADGISHDDGMGPGILRAANGGASFVAEGGSYNWIRPVFLAVPLICRIRDATSSITESGTSPQNRAKTYLRRVRDGGAEGGDGDGTIQQVPEHKNLLSSP